MSGPRSVGNGCTAKGVGLAGWTRIESRSRERSGYGAFDGPATHRAIAVFGVTRPHSFRFATLRIRSRFFRGRRGSSGCRIGVGCVGVRWLSGALLDHPGFVSRVARLGSSSCSTAGRGRTRGAWMRRVLTPDVIANANEHEQDHQTALAKSGTEDEEHKNRRQENPHESASFPVPVMGAKPERG